MSVLFADLVGFTPLSESRDPEEVRELLSRYFYSCRRLIELTGDDASLAEASEIFERLRSTPWLRRLDAARSGATAEMPA